MHITAIRHCAILALLIAPALAIDCALIPAAFAQAPSPQAIAEYKRKLQEYLEARAAFEAEAGAYWNAIADKRRARNAKRRERRPVTLADYVLPQPPLYDGPQRPVDPSPEPDQGPPRERKRIPVL